MGPERKLWHEFKRNTPQINGQGLKIAAYSVLLICWGTIVLGSFSLLN